MALELMASMFQAEVAEKIEESWTQRLEWKSFRADSEFPQKSLELMKLISQS